MTEQEARRRRIPAWIVFTVLRVLAFVVPLAVSYLLGASLLLAALIAAIVGLCISVIFLSQQRRAFSGELADLRTRPDKPRSPDAGEDELVEDAVVERRPTRSTPEG
ncbi:MAG TPA: DUF4229 domain-containing protein [Amnibacterium sp.]|nr:DUF4229 domain-containing protein [Amnibacterium sp.]